MLLRDLQSRIPISCDTINLGHVSTIRTGYTTVAAPSNAKTLGSLEYRRTWARRDCYQMQVLPKARLQLTAGLEDKARQVSPETDPKNLASG